MDWGIVPSNQGNPVANQAIANNASLQADINTVGGKWLTVIFRLRGTVTVGDLSSREVRPYMPDGTTLFSNGGLPSATSTGAVVSGADVTATSTWDLRGVQKVQVRFFNVNAGALTGDIYYFVL